MIKPELRSNTGALFSLTAPNLILPSAPQHKVFHLAAIDGNMRTMIARTIQVVLILLLAASSPLIQAGAAPDASELRLDRYTLQKPSARPEQIDLLSALVETQFPRSVDSLGSAIDYLLQRSGYRQIVTDETGAQMALPLPEVHRSIGPLPLRGVLKTIAGPALELKENTEQRVIWFEKRNQLASESSPLPDSLRQTTGNSQNATQPSQQQTWTLNAGTTLSENLATWAIAADWQLEWAFDQDYYIGHSAEFSGTFRQAVTEALEYYRRAPVMLAATFFTGNSVLLVEPALTRSR